MTASQPLHAPAAAAALLIGRPLPGTVGETKRVTHLFPSPKIYPARLRALCGATFHSSDLEWFDAPTGMPCTACLVRTPGPVQPAELEEGSGS